MKENTGTNAANIDHFEVPMITRVQGHDSLNGSVHTPISSPFYIVENAKAVNKSLPV